MVKKHSVIFTSFRGKLVFYHFLSLNWPQNSHSEEEIKDFFSWTRKLLERELKSGPHESKLTIRSFSASMPIYLWWPCESLPRNLVKTIEYGMRERMREWDRYSLTRSRKNCVRSFSCEEPRKACYFCTNFQSRRYIDAREKKCVHVSLISKVDVAFNLRLARSAVGWANTASVGLRFTHFALRGRSIIPFSVVRTKGDQAFSAGCRTVTIISRAFRGGIRRSEFRSVGRFLSRERERDESWLYRYRTFFAQDEAVKLSVSKKGPTRTSCRRVNISMPKHPEASDYDLKNESIALLYSASFIKTFGHSNIWSNCNFLDASYSANGKHALDGLAFPSWKNNIVGKNEKKKRAILSEGHTKRNYYKLIVSSPFFFRTSKDLFSHVRLCFVLTFVARNSVGFPMQHIESIFFQVKILESIGSRASTA